MTEGVTEEVGSGDPEEIELKFDVLRTAPARRLIEADELAGLHAIGPSRVVLMEDTYIDTASGRVARRAGPLASGGSTGSPR